MKCFFFIVDVDKSGPSVTLCNQSSFTINIVDAFGKHIMQFDAPYRCDSFLCPCYLKVYVYTYVWLCICIYCEGEIKTGKSSAKHILMTSGSLLSRDSQTHRVL